MSAFTLVEPCCGSAALTLHLLGAQRAVLPYQGSKWRFRRELAALAESLGFVGAPERVILTDPGPWGRAIRVILDRDSRQRLVARLAELAVQDARQVFDRLHGARVPEDDVAFTAEFLFLQRLSFSGKAVGAGRGCWASPGFNKTSAYGVAATESFGAVSPMVPSLIRTLRAYDAELADVAVEPFVESCENTLVYIDPPYVGSTAYPDGSMTRADVVALAQAWHCHGAAVMISEQEPLDLPDWNRTLISKGRDDTSPFRGQQQEWVTYLTPRALSATL